MPLPPWFLRSPSYVRDKRPDSLAHVLNLIVLRGDGRVPCVSRTFNSTIPVKICGSGERKVPQIIYVLQFKGSAAPVEGAEGQLTAATKASSAVVRTAVGADGVAG